MCVCVRLFKTEEVFNYNSSCTSDTCGSPDNNASSHSCCSALWVGGGGSQAYFSSNDVIGLVRLREILIRADRCSPTADLRGVPHTELIMKP